MEKFISANGQMNQERMLKIGILVLFAIFLVSTMAFSGNNTDSLGLTGVYDTIAEWTTDRNLTLVITTVVVVVGLVRWWQVGGMAGGVQFASLFILAVVFYNLNNIVNAIQTGNF